MKLKLLGLLIFVFVFCGCSIDYHLKITSDKKFIEEVIFRIDRGAYPEDDKIAEKMIKDELDAYQEYEEYNQYSYKLRITKDIIYIIINGEHQNIEQYMDSPLYKNVFQWVAAFEGSTYQFETTGSRYDVNMGADSDSYFYVSDLNVYIKTHNKVIKTNALDENYRKNVFQWQIENNDVPNKIEIELDYSKRYDIIMLDFVFNNLITVISFTIIIGTLVVVGGYFMMQNRLKNKL